MTPKGWWAMGPSPSAEEAGGRMTAVEAELLVDIGDAAIVDGLLGRRPGAPPVHLLPPALQQRLGVFVTLKVDSSLNGCIGSIDGTEPVGHAVAHHAWAAAFTDPRLPPLRRADYQRLLIEVSVLSGLSTIPASSRSELLDQLRPHTDGVVITAGGRRALFLPAVWEQLPDPADFLDHLQLKAGFRPGGWPPGMLTYRFTADRFARRAGEQGTVSPAA